MAVSCSPTLSNSNEALSLLTSLSCVQSWGQCLFCVKQNVEQTMLCVCALTYMQVSLPTYRVWNSCYWLFCWRKVEEVLQHCCHPYLMDTQLERFGMAWMSFLGKNVDTSWKETCVFSSRGWIHFKLSAQAIPCPRTRFRKDVKSEKNFWECQSDQWEKGKNSETEVTQRSTRPCFVSYTHCWWPHTPWAFVYCHVSTCLPMSFLLAHGECSQPVKLPFFDPTTIFIHDINVMIITRSSAFPWTVKRLFSVIIPEFLERVQVTVFSYTVERLRQKFPGI